MISRRAHAGFTLIEIAIAFVILGLAAGALVPVLRASPARLAGAHNQMLAVLAARSVLAELDANDALAAGELSGNLHRNVTWKVRVEPFHPTTAGTTALTTPYLVSVQAAVEAAPSPATASFTTVRLQARKP